MKRSGLAWLVGLVALAVAPFLIGPFERDLLVKIMIFSIFALSLDLLVGVTGLVSLGHAAFFGIGAYVAVLASPASEAASGWWLLPLAIATSGIAALATGALALRTRGVYFIMVTLAFAQMAYFVFHDTKLGGGTDGIYLYFKPRFAIAGGELVDLDNPRGLFYAVLGFFVATVALLSLVFRSRFGHALVGIRLNEQRMRAAGFSTTAYQLAAFTLAGMIAGLAGFLFAVKDGFVNPELLAWHQSGAVLLMIILGGLGRLSGAVVGAFAFALLQELYSSQALFGDWASHWQLPLGLTIIAAVALMPRGIMGLRIKGFNAGRRIAVDKGKAP